MAERRRALVTGGNRGIGLAVVELLAGRGYDVVLGSRDREAGVRAAASIRGAAGASAGTIEVVALDVADPHSVAALDRALGPRGVDVLVNNAAFNPRHDHDPAAIELAWQTNLLGAWRTARAVLPGMRARGWGRIVNASTELAIEAHLPRRGGGYDITKIALNAMTRALAEDLAGTGILVNACSPGWCRTDMGGPTAPRSIAQGAASLVWGVSLPDDGPSGGFFQDGHPLAW
ncbi:MAG: SDR family NAD(P)-dependent oxidoreductase [Myxococcota bacterium]